MPAKKKAAKPKTKSKKAVRSERSRTVKKKVPAKKVLKAPKPSKVSKKTASKKAKKPAKVEEVVAGQLLGKVEDYFAHINVIALTLKGPLSAGDTIRVKGHTTDLIQKVESIQTEHLPVSAAKAGDGVGIKISGRCRRGDKVYKI